MMTSAQLIAYSIRSGPCRTATTHLVSHVGATQTECGLTIYADWWRIKRRQVGEPSCFYCRRIAQAAVEGRRLWKRRERNK
jgi:hypothetical protein